MLTEMVGYSRKTEGYAKWNKEKNTGNQQWREGNWDSNQPSGAEGRNKHPTSTEWRNKNSKNDERLGNLWDNFKHSNIRIIGMPEGEEEEQEIENIWKNNGELLQSGKGNRLPGSPGSSESPEEVGPKEEHTKANHN